MRRCPDAGTDSPGRYDTTKIPTRRIDAFRLVEVILDYIAFWTISRSIHSQHLSIRPLKSGSSALERPGADPVTREAYSHEVSSAGFWPGGNGIDGPAFYSYAAPEPPHFAQQPVRPAAAFYHTQLKEFLLMYDDVRKTDSPRTTLMDFLQSTYEAAAILGDWNRKTLEREVEASL